MVCGAARSRVLLSRTAYLEENCVCSSAWECMSTRNLSGSELCEYLQAIAKHFAKDSMTS